MKDRIKNMSRRNFIKQSFIGVALLNISPMVNFAWGKSVSPLRLGGQIFEKFDSPDEWVSICKKLKYRAAYCPVSAEESDDVIRAYAGAAKKNDIIIAEVGAWSNPISPDEKMRKEAIAKCKKQLHLADKIGANCCVNISGSRNPTFWAGPHKDNLTQETFDRIVEVTRHIIDEVKPTRTCFALETMPCSYPDSPDSYVRLMKAIDRERFAAHLDPVNLISSPQLYYNNTRLINECFEKLGPYIKSCHAKDIQIREDVYMFHADEIRPGLGVLDYAAFLKNLSKIPDTPLMIEHLNSAEEYRLAADYIRSVAEEEGLAL